MEKEQVTNTPESFADLLKARGDVPITVLRSVRDQIDGLLQLVDTMDEALTCRLHRPKPKLLLPPRCGRSTPTSKTRAIAKCWPIST